MHLELLLLLLLMLLLHLKLLLLLLLLRQLRQLRLLRGALALLLEAASLHRVCQRFECLFDEQIRIVTTLP